MVTNLQIPYFKVATCPNYILISIEKLLIAFLTNVVWKIARFENFQVLRVMVGPFSILLVKFFFVKIIVHKKD